MKKIAPIIVIIIILSLFGIIYFKDIKTNLTGNAVNQYFPDNEIGNDIFNTSEKLTTSKKILENRNFSYELRQIYNREYNVKGSKKVIDVIILDFKEDYNFSKVNKEMGFPKITIGETEKKNILGEDVEIRNYVILREGSFFVYAWNEENYVFFVTGDYTLKDEIELVVENVIGKYNKI